MAFDSHGTLYVSESDGTNGAIGIVTSPGTIQTYATFADVYCRSVRVAGSGAFIDDAVRIGGSRFARAPVASVLLGQRNKPGSERHGNAHAPVPFPREQF